MQQPRDYHGRFKGRNTYGTQKALLIAGLTFSVLVLMACLVQLMS